MKCRHLLGVGGACRPRYCSNPLVQQGCGIAPVIAGVDHTVVLGLQTKGSLGLCFSLMPGMVTGSVDPCRNLAKTLLFCVS